MLAWVGPDGFPLAVRLPVSVDAGARRISLGAEPAGLPLAEGRACLTAHGHDADFKWRENFQVRGDLVSAPGGWALVPHKLVGGLELPNQGILGRYRHAIGQVRWLLPNCAQRVAKAQGAGRPLAGMAQLSGKDSRPACQGPAG